MLAQRVRQDQIANDLANASTPGYKADRAATGELRRTCCCETLPDKETVGSK